MKNLLWLVTAVVVVAAGAFWLVGQKQRTPPQQQVTAPTPTQQAVKVKEITVVGDEYSFLPAKISVKAGERVKINFENKGELPHNMTIDELGFATNTISSGKITSAEFTANKSGTFTMYCSIGDHRSLGMVGEVTID